MYQNTPAYVAGFIQLQLDHTFVCVSLASVKLHQLTSKSALNQTRKGLHLAWGKTQASTILIRIGRCTVIKIVIFQVYLD
jgi:hypothetical protein